MTSYRPKIKQDKNGTVSDLALDAETVQGIDVVDRLKSVPLYVASVSGTAAVTTSGSYYHAKWNLTDARVSTLYDGLRVSFKIPVAGNGSYGTGISINSGDYHPVVFNVNSMVGTRYGVNSTMTLVYNSTQTGTLYIDNTSTTITGVWQIEDYDSNTTTTYGTLNYYMRPYVGANRLTAYKIVALDKDNRVIPITTEQYMGTYSTSTTYSKDDIVVSSSKYYKSLANSNKNKAVSNTSYWTQITMPSQFTPNTTAFKPDKIYFYNTTAGIAAGAVIGGQTLTEIGYNTSVCAYTFWASITSYKMIYLQGTYNTTTGLFTLDTGANYYKLVPNNTANLTLSSYFTSGKDYIFVGATYSSANYFQLAMVNTMYHFDGTNLVPYDTYRANSIASSIPAPVTESTVSGWGFTKNAGTVTSVDNISPSSGNVALSAVRYVSQSLTDAQKTQARSNIGAGTSNFTGYTSSNKLSTDYINNTAGWTSVTESTVSGWGFTKNVGTVTKVNNTSPDSNGNVSITIPTVDYPVTDVKVNNTSVVSSKVASISAVTKLGTRTGDITIANLKSDLGLGSAAYTDSTAYAASSHTHSSLKNGNYTASLPTLTANATLALTSDIPSAVTESTVSGWGFTKNTGTVTSVDSVSPSSGNVALSAVRYVSQSLTDAQKAQARSNIGAGTSNFTGYTSSNKLSTDYINNTAGWTSVTESTVSGWGFTKNNGTVTSVSAGTGLSISGTASTTPTVNVASGYKLLTTTEYNTLNAKVSNVQSDWNATTGLARILNKPDILPITNYTGDSPVELYNLSKGRYINATSNDIYLFNYAGGSTLPLVKWHPGEILTVLDNLHNWVLETLYANEYYIFSGKANSRFDQSEYRGFSAADVPAASSSGLGSVGKPLYIDVITSEQGMKQLVFKECNQFAGATKLILNGTDLSSLATFLYAPTTSGTSGQFLKSAGADASPTWVDLATVATSGSYNDLTNKPTIPTKSSWNYDDMYVKYSAAQTLTETQQAQARANIGASRNPHEHPTYLETTADTPSVTMVPDASYKLTTGGGSNVIFKTPSDAYKLMESLRKGSEETTAVGYYKIATINHNNWNFCNFTMLITNTYSGTVYNTIFECRCSDNNNTLVNFGLNIIAGTDISSKLTYLYTKDTNNYITKIEVFIHATRFEHPICYILNTRPGQQLVIPTQQEFNKVTPDQPDGTTMTGTAKYIYDSMYLKKGGDTIGTGGLTLGSGNGNGILFPSSAASSGDSSIGIYDSSNNNQYCTLNGFISGTFTVGHGNFPLNLRGSATRPQYKGADLALKSDIPTRVTGSMSYPTNTGDLATLFNLINNHRNIRLWTYKYTSGSRSTEIRNLLYFTTHNELSGSLYTVKLSYINSSGTLTEMTSGTIYYEYFT